MIIRSQNKSKIINFNQVSDLVISKNRVGEYDILACYSYFAESDCGFSTIATFSTEEKAIKVLDMMCDALKLGSRVFKMPQDCEVQDEGSYRKAD